MSGNRSVFADIMEGFGKTIAVVGAVAVSLGIGNYIGHLIMKRKPEEYMDEEKEKKCSVCHQTLDDQNAKEKGPFHMTQPSTQRDCRRQECTKDECYRQAQEEQSNSQKSPETLTWTSVQQIKQEKVERRQKLAQDMYRKQEAAQAAYVKRVEEEAAWKVRAELTPVTQERLEEALSPMKLTRSTPLSEEEKQSSNTLQVAEPVVSQTQQVAEPTTELSGTQLPLEEQPNQSLEIKVTQPEPLPNQIAATTATNPPTHYNPDMLFPPGVQWVYPADQFTRTQETSLETSQWDLVGQHSAVLPARENQEQDVQAVPIPSGMEMLMYSDPQQLDAPVAETQTGLELTAPTELLERTTPVEQLELSLNEPNLSEPNLNEPSLSEPSNILDPALVHPDGTTDLLDESSTVVLLAKMKVTHSG